AGSLAIDRRHQKFAGAELGGLDRPVERVQPGALTAVIDKCFVGTIILALRFDGYHDRRRAELSGRILDEHRISNGASIQGYLVRSGAKRHANIVESAQSSPNSQRDEYLSRGAFDDLE